MTDQIVTRHAFNLGMYRKDLNQAINHSRRMTMLCHRLVLAWAAVNTENNEFLHQIQAMAYNDLVRENEQLREENEHLWNLLEKDIAP